MFNNLLNRFCGRALISLLMIILIMGSCSKEKPEGENEGQTKGDRPVTRESTGIILEGVDGKSVSFNDFKGKIVLLNFWVTWKTDSEEFIGIMNGIQRKFKKNVDVISVAMDKGGPPVVRSFMSRVPIDHHVFINGEKIANRFGGARKLPTTYIILRDGKVFKRFDGLERKQVYEDWLIRLLSHRM